MNHARHRLPGESFEDYKKRRAASDRALADAEANPPPGSSTPWGTRTRKRLARDLGQHPKLKAERQRRVRRGHGPTWPGTDDQRKQSRPVIVLHPVRAAIKLIPKPGPAALPGDWRLWSAAVDAARQLGETLPKHVLDREAS